MTMHLAGYESPRPRRGGLATIREDVHLHIAAAEARAAVSDPTAYQQWLSEAMSGFSADTEGLRFELSLPGRTETVSLRRHPTDDPREVVFRIDEGGALDLLTWAVFPEGQRECHLTVELAYRPAGGFLGGAAETLVHRAYRTQAFRDLLWNLKRALEPPVPEQLEDAVPGSADSTEP